MPEREELVPISEAKIRLHELIARLRSRDVLLLRHGRPVAVIVDHQRFNSLIDRIEDLEDRLSVFEAGQESEDLLRPWANVQAEAGILSESESSGG